ncbi:hypothetical protein BH11BAC2_BH11BAC2_12610 [soil metagenome]
MKPGCCSAKKGILKASHDVASKNTLQLKSPDFRIVVLSALMQFNLSEIISFVQILRYHSPPLQALFSVNLLIQEFRI